MKLLPCWLILFAMGGLSAEAQRSSLIGDWKSKAGSIVRVEPCGAALCMRLVEILNTNGVTTDTHNPDPALRNRPLCGLQIGSGFIIDDAEHASHGTLYDPKSGKTYRGNLSLKGMTLHLRGYIGAPIFGESQDWVHPVQRVIPCSTR